MSKRAAVFISSGLGNAITLVPLVNALKKKGFHVTGIFTSPFKCEDLFNESSVFDDKMVIKSKAMVLFKSLSARKRFHVLFADRFSCTRKHFLLAESIADKTYIQYDIGDSPGAFIYKAPSPNLHSIYNNLLLAEDYIDVREKPDMSFFTGLKSGKHPIIFQPGSGNNNTPWKSWPLENWIDLLRRIDYPITVIGDKNESVFIEKLKAAKIPKLSLQIGKTSLKKMVRDVSSAPLFLGHDSGPMHIAAAANVPTFSIWGGSNSLLFGYESLFPERHRVIQLSVPCNPCDSWLRRNTSRVSDPANCPDFKCIREIQTEYVAEELIKFTEQVGIKIPIK